MCSSPCRNERSWIGFFAVIVGVLMLLDHFAAIPHETWIYFWPAVLVVTGLKLMISGMCKCKMCKASEACPCGKSDCNCDENCEMPMPMSAPAKKMKKKGGRKK